MMDVDEDALRCDFAETYHIYDLEAIPAGLAATLAAGLRDNSRIHCKMANLRVTPEVFLLAQCYDLLALLWWSRTADGQRNRNRPKSLAETLREEEKQSDVLAYDSPEAYEQARAELLRKIRGDQHA